MVERQGCDSGDVIEVVVRIALPRDRLPDVVDHVAMAQHRALRNTGSAPGVLQECDVGVA